MSKILNKVDDFLHKKIHKKMLQEDPMTILDNPRINILKLLKNTYDFKGTVADLGCGNGYFGIALAKYFKKIKRVDCIEASSLAVESVIPRNIEYYKIGKKVKPINRSFDDLDSQKYDFVFAMGALHHSKDLYKTLKSIFNSLKPNGLLIAQEPSMPDTTTHENYKKKYNTVEVIHDLKIRNGDRYDRFFRECEYKYNLVINGFDILKWVEFNQYDFKGKLNLLNLLRKAKNKLIFGNIIKKQNNIARVKPILIVAKKSNSKKFYHDK